MFRICGANDRHGRLQEIADGRALAHELRIYTDAEIVTELLATGLLQGGHDDGLRRAWQYRAPHDDQVKSVLFPQDLSDFPADRFNMTEVELPISQAWRTNAKK